MAKKHGYWNKSGDFVETASKEEATYAWRKERGYKAEGVFATDDGVIDTRGKGGGGGGGGKDGAPTNLLGEQGKPEMPSRGKPEVPGMSMSEAAKAVTSGYNPQSSSVWDAAKAAGLPDYAVPGWSPPDPRDDARRGRGFNTDYLSGPRSTQPSANVSLADVYDTNTQNAMRQRTLNANIKTGQAVADLIPSGAEGPAALFSIIDAAAELGISEQNAHAAYAAYKAKEVADGVEGRNGNAPANTNNMIEGATRPIDINEESGMSVDQLLAWGGRYTEASFWGGVDSTGQWFEGAYDPDTKELINPDKQPILLSPDLANVLGITEEERQMMGYSANYPYELKDKPPPAVSGGYGGYRYRGGGYGRNYSSGGYGSGGGYVSTPLVMWRIGT